MSFNILSYNATSLVGRHKRAEVNSIINSEKIQIILLQETHLGERHSLFLSGMKVIRRDDGVGTAIGVKCNIKFESVQIDLDVLNNTAVRTKCRWGTVFGRVEQW